MLFKLIAVVLSNYGFAQKIHIKNVPDVVKTAFESQFKNVSDIEWEKEGDLYEVEFEMSETEHSVVYDGAGNLLETEIEIKISELPESITEYIKANYKSKIKEASKITDSLGTETFEVEIKGKDLIFDYNGTLIKSKKN